MQATRQYAVYRMNQGSRWWPGKSLYVVRTPGNEPRNFIVLRIGGKHQRRILTRRLPQNQSCSMERLRWRHELMRASNI
jgi:hypothetical protein